MSFFVCCLNAHCGEGDALGCVFWHSYGLVKCGDEIVPALVCMWNYSTVHVHESQDGPSTMELDKCPVVD